MSRDAPTGWRSSLVTRLALLWALLIAAIVTIFGYISYRGNREHLISAREETLRQDARAAELKVKSAVAAVLQDIIYLVRTPTLREYVRRRTEADRNFWKALVEDDFRALLEGKQAVRIIQGYHGASHRGRVTFCAQNEVEALKHHLPLGQIHLRVGGPFEPPVLHVANDADDLAPGASAAHEHALSHRRRSRPVPFGHCLVDDDDELRLAVVSGCEVAPSSSGMPIVVK